MSDQYFVLRDDVGVTADGNLEPLHEIGIVVAVPIMRGGELVEDPHRYVVRPAESIGDGEYARVIPGTRLVHVTDPRVAQGLVQTGLFAETDPPTKKIQAEQRREKKAAEQEAGTHEPDPDNPTTVLEV